MLGFSNPVPTAMNAGPAWQHMEGSPDPNEVYRRDTGWIDESQILISEVSTPSHGVGYEIRYALERGKPVLCLYRRGARVSKMLTGNTMSGISIADYGDIPEALELMRHFIEKNSG